ncbi:MAG: DUF1349 domain-containing protein [Planctomycetes bacterium]|nr:DUF1349 domain-containing protein [Planctomycetota bacterium]
MPRAAVAVALVVAPLFAVAAPAPKPASAELIAKHYGTTAGDGAEFELSGTQLTVRSTFGKGNHSFNWADRNPVPRTVLSARGDFELTVRVLDAVPPNKDARHDGHSAETRAGLYILGGQSSFRYYLSQSYQRFPGAPQDGKLQRWLGLEANYPRGGASGSVGRPEDGKSTWLRLIRKDKDVSMSHSADGEKWSPPNNPFKNIDMSIPDEVTVGLFFSHSTYQFAHATFDRLTITKAK